MNKYEAICERVEGLTAGTVCTIYYDEKKNFFDETGKMDIVWTDNTHFTVNGYGIDVFFELP